MGPGYNGGAIRHFCLNAYATVASQQQGPGWPPTFPSSPTLSAARVIKTDIAAPPLNTPPLPGAPHNDKTPTATHTHCATSYTTVPTQGLRQNLHPASQRKQVHILHCGVQENTVPKSPSAGTKTCLMMLPLRSAPLGTPHNLAAHISFPMWHLSSPATSTHSLPHCTRRHTPCHSVGSGRAGQGSCRTWQRA